MSQEEQSKRPVSAQMCHLPNSNLGNTGKEIVKIQMISGMYLYFVTEYKYALIVPT